jgi:hypothetical protein
MENEKTIVYLAVPYSHPDPAVRQERFEKVNKVAARLMNEHKLNIFSPISHSHPLAISGQLPTDWSFWGNYDSAFLKVSKKMIVLMLPDWDKSVGLAAELKIAKELGLEIEYITE